MKKFIVSGILILACGCQYFSDTNSQQTPFSNTEGVVQVRYYVKKNEGMEPSIREASMSYANRFDIDAFVPMLAVGFLVSDTEVVSKDYQIHPQYISQIVVSANGAQSVAKLVAISTEKGAVKLVLDKPLINAKALQFVEGKTKSALVYSPTREGFFLINTAPPKTEVSRYTANQLVFAKHPSDALLIDGEAKPVALNFLEMTLDSEACTAPAQWKWECQKMLYAKLDSMQAELEKKFFPVRLNLKLTQEQMRAWEVKSEFQTFGWVFKQKDTESWMAIASEFKPQLTATLSGITAIDVEGKEYKGQFVGTLKDWGIMIAKFTDLPATPIVWEPNTPIYDHKRYVVAGVATVNNRLLKTLSYTDVSDNAITFLETPCITASQAIEDKSNILLTQDGKVLGVSIKANSPIYSGRRYRSDDTIVSAKFLAGLIGNYEKNINPNNVPTENKRPLPAPWFGADIRNLDNQLAEVQSYDKKGDEAIITDIYEGSPANKAGLKRDDIIVSWGTSPSQAISIDLGYSRSYDGDFPWEQLDQVPETYYARIPSPFPPATNNFLDKLGELGAGTTIYLNIFRDGDYMNVPVTTEEGRMNFETAPRLRSKALGVTVKDATYEVRKYLNLKPTDPGVVICELTMGGKSSVAGMKPYELITKINEKPIRSTDDFREAVKSASDELRIVLNRIGKERIVKLRKSGGTKPTPAPTETP